MQQPRPVAHPYDDLLGRDVSLRVTGLAPGTWTVEHHRVDEAHSNVFATWRELGGAEQDWPRDDEWDRLRAADVLAELEPARTVEVGDDGRFALDFAIPLPGISGIALRRT